MAQQKETAVTPERFAAGMTWTQWMEHIQRNKAKFQYNYDETRISPEDAAAFRRLAQSSGGPAKMLVLGEDWCPDVFRGLGVLARIAEAGGMELRILARDDNLDVMNEFLKDGQYQSIPTAVFYTRDHEYITHWIERPAKADAEMGEIQKLFEGLDRERDREEMRRRYDEFQQGPVWASWREATIKEIRELLESKMK